VNGNLNLNGNLKYKNNNIIQIVEIEAFQSAFNFGDSDNNQSFDITNGDTTNRSKIENARYLLCEVFLHSGDDDHFVTTFARSSITPNLISWASSTASQTSTATQTFDNRLVRNDIVFLQHDGELSNYNPEYGIWYSSILLPCSNYTVYMDRNGSSSGTPNIVTFIVKGYSI